MEKIKFNIDESNFILNVFDVGIATLNSGSRNDKNSVEKAILLKNKLTKFFVFQDNRIENALKRLEDVIKLAEEHNAKLLVSQK